MVKVIVTLRNHKGAACRNDNYPRNHNTGFVSCVFRETTTRQT